MRYLWGEAMFMAKTYQLHPIEDMTIPIAIKLYREWMLQTVKMRLKEFPPFDKCIEVNIEWFYLQNPVINKESE